MRLTAGQIHSVLRRAGWPESLIVEMGAIALGESGGNPAAVNPGRPGRPEYSVGLLQINMRAHGSKYGTEAQLKDPLTNARGALAIYRKQGLRAWGAYTDGRYKQYLPQSRAAYSGGAGGVMGDAGISYAAGAKNGATAGAQGLTMLGGVVLAVLGIVIVNEFLN